MRLLDNSANYNIRDTYTEKVMKNILFNKIVVVSSLTLLVASCAMVKETHMPDGRKGYSISCDGAAVGINVCFEKAGELCGAKGYEIINREGQVIPYGHGAANVQGNTTSVQASSYVTYGAFNTKSIMVICRK
jgi:hypothetical protein